MTMLLRRPDLHGLALALLVSASCGDEAGTRSAPGTTTYDSAGVTVVVNEGPDIPLDVEETLRIGSIDGPPETQFYRVTDVAVDSAGYVWVADAYGAVRQYDADGRYVGEIGGMGEGPGEDPQGYFRIHVAEGSILLIGGSPTLHLFARSGDVVASRSPFLSEGRYFVMIGRGTDGWLFVDDVRPPDARGRVRADWQIVKASMEGGPPELLFSLPGEVHVQTETGWATGRFLDGDPTIAVGGGGRIYYSHPTDYGVAVYSETGDPVRVIRRRVEKRAIPGSIEDSIRSVARASLEEIQPSVPPDRSRIERIVQQALPSSARDSLPVLDRILVSRDGSSWVRRADQYADPAARAVAGAFGYIERAWLDRWRGEPTFDLFEPDGAYRGSVVLPSRFVPMTVVGDTVFGVLHDELDVEYVVALTARARGPDAER